MLRVRDERWPIRGTFAISRGSRTEAHVVVVEIEQDGVRGRGECVPYARYGESVESVCAAIQAVSEAISDGADREAVQGLLPAGAARNAVDCALWDFEAKRLGTAAWQMAGVDEPADLVTAYTLSLDTPAAMAANARNNADRPLLKLKLTGEGDLERVRAVHEAAPESRLIVDANEGWDRGVYENMAPQLGGLGVEMIEQPFPSDNDRALAELPHPVAICADESCHATEGLAALADRYDVINIKLDKTGGLTEALRLKAQAEARGLGIMVGCMLGTSLAMAPAMLVAAGARYVDLDGPLLLAEDREPGIAFDGSVMRPAPAGLWGG